MSISFEEIRNDRELSVYIQKGNELLGVLGYTDHSAAHTLKVGETAAQILSRLRYDQRSIELCRIAGYIHDIGNMVNRVNHAQTGAIMAVNILSRMGVDPEEIAIIAGAIGNHDEQTGISISPVAAALVIGDKTDVRRSRVRNTNFATFDIHDRVNYAVERADLTIERDLILLDLKIDTTICSVMDYFEIFLTRMIMCRRAAEFLESRFGLHINGAKLL